MQRPEFVNDEICHIFNRGVDKRNIFLDKSDYIRFIHNLFEFNDTTPAPPSNIRYNIRKPSEFSKIECLDVGKPNIDLIVREEKRKHKRNLLVEILCWCLMPNHFHLLVRQLVEGGITLFLKKLCGGFALYFNEKYSRKGTLFEGRYKIVIVEQENHFLHLPFYIHTNPLDMIEPEWRLGKIEDPKKAIEFLKNYRYSSHLDFLGRKNFPSVSQREFLLEVMGGPKNYERQFIDWILSMDAHQLETLESIAIEI